MCTHVPVYYVQVSRKHAWKLRLSILTWNKPTGRKDIEVSKYIYNVSLKKKQKLWQYIKAGQS